jgi:gamma-glutamyltranspeptidase / glutathione hydrolase
MSVGEAVNAPRFHHQWLPDMIMHEEKAIPPQVRESLKKMGHTLKERGAIGRVEAITINNNVIQGAADIRGDDDAKGF